MDEILDLLTEILSSGEEIPDEFLDQVIAFLEAERPIESPAPEVPASEYPSSNVNGMKINPDTGELLVQFHGPYPQAEGPIYKYSGVPPYLFNILAKGGVAPKTSGKNKYHEWVRGITPSLGASVNAILKAGGFKYQRLS